MFCHPLSHCAEHLWQGLQGQCRPVVSWGLLFLYPSSRLPRWLSGRFWAWVWWIWLKLNFRSLLGVWGFAKWGERMIQWWHQQAVWTRTCLKLVRLASLQVLGWPLMQWLQLWRKCLSNKANELLIILDFWLLSPVVLPGRNTHTGWTLVLYLSVLCSDCDIFSAEGNNWCYGLSRFRSISLQTIGLGDCHRSLQTKYSILTSILNKIF